MAVSVVCGQTMRLVVMTSIIFNMYTIYIFYIYICMCMTWIIHTKSEFLSSESRLGVILRQTHSPSVHVCQFLYLFNGEDSKLSFCRSPVSVGRTSKVPASDCRVAKHLQNLLQNVQCL